MKFEFDSNKDLPLLTILVYIAVSLFIANIFIQAWLVHSYDNLVNYPLDFLCLFISHYPPDTTAIIVISSFDAILISILYPQVIKIQREAMEIFGTESLLNILMNRVKILIYYPWFIFGHMMVGVGILMFYGNNPNEDITALGTSISWLVFLSVIPLFFYLIEFLKKLGNISSPEFILNQILLKDVAEIIKK